jgi:hypothetical protein
MVIASCTCHAGFFGGGGGGGRQQALVRPNELEATGRGNEFCDGSLKGYPFFWLLEQFLLTKHKLLSIPSAGNWYIAMKQSIEMEEKHFTSSLNICPEAHCVKGSGVGGVTPSPSPTPYRYFQDDQ